MDVTSHHATKLDVCNDSRKLLKLAEYKWAKVVESLIAEWKTITVMESCTGGLISALITNVEGSSQIFPGSFVTYSNDAKVMAGVPAETIKEFGVYSRQTAIAMAKACRKTMGTDIGIGVTGTFRNADLSNSDSIPGSVDAAIVIDVLDNLCESNVNQRIFTLHVEGFNSLARMDDKLNFATLLADEILVTM